MHSTPIKKKNVRKNFSCVFEHELKHSIILLIMQDKVDFNFNMIYKALKKTWVLSMSSQFILKYPFKMHNIFPLCKSAEFLFFFLIEISSTSKSETIYFYTSSFLRILWVSIIKQNSNWWKNNFKQAQCRWRLNIENFIQFTIDD